MTVSPSQRSYTSLFQLAHHFLRDNFLINEIGDAQFYQTQICKFGGMKFNTHTVLSRDKVLISFFLFILLQVLLCSRKYMKLPKCGILVNKTTYLFTSVKSNISRGCVKILEILEGSGGGGGKFWGLILENHMANPFCGGGMDIFCRNHTMFNTVHKCQSIKLLWSKCKFEIFLF